MSQKQIALIGSGRMAEIYGTTLLEHSNVSIAAVIGNTQEKTTRLANKLNAKAYSNGDISFVLDSSSQLDGIVVATPEWIRVDLLSKLIPLNKKLLVEKPLVTSRSDLNTLQKFGPKLLQNISVTHSLRFNPKFSQAKKLLNDLGEIRHIHARRTGCLRTVKRVLGKTPLAFWLTCHDVDLMRWYTSSEVTSVTAVSRNQLQSDDDYLIATLTFENGVHAIEEVSWCSPSLSSSAPACVFTVFGTKGMLQIEDSSSNVLLFKENNQVISTDTEDYYEIEGCYEGTFKHLVNCWLDSIEDKRKFPISFEQAAKSIEVCAKIEDAIHLSSVAQQKTRDSLPEVRA
ncbi:MAG: Gfo/Idh/MocA family protein [Bacteriovoracia bacterium]